MPTSNVNLTPELAEFVQAQVEGGQFNNNSEVHRAALAAMKKAEEQRQAQLAWLRGEIQKGVDDIEAGRFTEINGPEELTQLLSRCSEEATRRVESRGAKIAP